MKQRDTLFIFISSFLLVLAWVAFSVYHAVATSTLSDALSVQIAPIDPTFDTSTLEKLKDRTHINPLYQASASGTTVLPTTTLTPTPSEEPQSIITPAVTATPSGQIGSTP